MAGVLLIASSLLWLSPASAQQPGAGLYGTVTKSPASPVCAAEHPCTAPAAGATVEALRGQAVVARRTTDRKGGYRLPLRPGRYVVRIVGAFRGRRKIAVVRSRTWTHLNLTFDSGIR